MWNVVRAVVIGLLTLTMTSCGWLGCRKKSIEYDRALPPGEVALVLIDPKDYPDFGSGFHHREGLIESIDNSLEYFKKPSSQKVYPYRSNPAISHERAVRTLIAFKDIVTKAKDPSDLDKMIRERFAVYMSRGCDEKGTVLFTGYCTPIFKGSLTQTAEYRFPLYKRPPDLVAKEDGTPLGRKTEGGEIVPYYTRREIEVQKVFAGKGLELVYLKSPLDVHIIHIQGSCKIQLPDGKEFPVGYAGKTDRPYTSVGLSLVQDGKIKKEDLSLQKMMEYFEQHPNEMTAYIYRNDSYVFFTNYDAGVRGSLNTPVIKHRSLATDHSVFPRGLIAYAVTAVPELKTRDQVSLEPFYSFACDQDTGGAIRSAGRCDIYMGVGNEALLLAGRTRHEGKLYYLALK
jgi:membrane-bound lytic murein transglycosylase A